MDTYTLLIIFKEPTMIGKKAYIEKEIENVNSCNIVKIGNRDFCEIEKNKYKSFISFNNIAFIGKKNDFYNLDEELGK